MISPMFYRILALFLISTIGGSKCENRPKDDSDLQRVMSDQEGEQDYLHQIERVLSTILEKIEKMNKRLTVSEEINNNQTDGMASLRLEVKNLSSVVFPEQPSKPPPIEIPPEPTTKAPELPERASKPPTVEIPTEPTTPAPELKPTDSFAQTESPFVLDVSTLPDGRGAIVFDEKEMSWRVRRFWTLERAGEMRFTMENNDLKGNSRITISGFKTTQYYNSTDHLDEVYINSSTSNGTEFTVSGVVILVTLTTRNTDGSFILRFLHKRNDKVLIPGRVLYPSTFGTGEGRVVAAFPENNAADYSNNADHFMIISRPSGRDFDLTRSFQDIEKRKDYFRYYSIADDAEKTRFKYNWIWWGRYDRFNDYWGRHSTIVLFFSSDGSGTGKGYEITIE